MAKIERVIAIELLLDDLTQIRVSRSFDTIIWSGTPRSPDAAERDAARQVLMKAEFEALQQAKEAEEAK